jgi:hypothetical protein
MKKMVFIFLVLIVPLSMLFSTGFKPNAQNRNSIFPQASLSRDWHIMQSISESWDGMNWMNSEKYVNYYNPQNTSKIDSVLSFEYEESSSLWILNGKTTFTYLPDQEHVSFTETSFIFGPMNLPFVRTYAGYDNQMRLTSWSITMYDMQNFTWNSVSRMQLTYGANNTFSVTQWDAGDEETPPMYGRASFEYDGAGRVILETWQASADSSNWVNDYQTTRVYHPHDNSTGADFIEQIALLLPLTSAMGGEGPYFGMVSSELQKHWESAWVNDDNAIYTYNAQDKLTEKLIQDWVNNAWSDVDRESSTYDNNGNLNQTVSQYYNGTGWENSDRYTYTWSMFTDADDNAIYPVDKFSMLAYPNPSMNTLDFQINSKSQLPIVVAIYNLKGQLVKRLSAENSSSLHWDGKNAQNLLVSPGIYFYQASQGSAIYNGKLIRIK